MPDDDATPGGSATAGPHPKRPIDTVVVPIDGSDASDRAAAAAVEVAGRYDATLHTVVVFDERVARALDRGDRTPEAVATESEALAADVRALADSAGVPTTDAMAMGFSTRRKAQHPGSVVLDCADDAGADFVVVPREPVEDAAATLAKAAEYVVAYADQPVLSV